MRARYLAVHWGSPQPLLTTRVPNPKVGQEFPKLVLCRQAGVHEVAIDMPPLLQAAVVAHRQFVADDEGNVAIG